METQTKIIKTEEYSDISNKFTMTYRLVNKQEQKTKNDFKKKQINSLLNVLDSLNKSKPFKLESSNMKSNPKEWIKELLTSNEYNKKVSKYLLNSFSEEMNTNMRKQDKYVILILLENRLILAHSTMGEKSINPDFKVFERLLDKDNIMRFVSFEYKNNEIKMEHYEKNKSKFFREWLGIPEKNLFYTFGGENKFYSEINGYPIVIELKDEDIEKISQENTIKIENKSITFNNPLEGLEIKHITRQNKKYHNYNSFHREYISRRYQLQYYSEKYKKLNQTMDLYMEKIYDYPERVGTENQTINIVKYNENIFIFFCWDKIKLTEEFLNKLMIKLLNNEETCIFHAGTPINEEPLIIGNLKILNKLNIDMFSPLIDYFNENEFPPSISKLLIYGIFCCLIKYNDNFPIKILFKEIIKKLNEEIRINGEIKEDKIIELKSSSYISGNNKQITKNLTEDIPKKIKENSFKFYILGYDEKEKQIDPVTSNKFNDERINKIAESLKEELKIENIVLNKVPINEKNCILILLVKN